MPSRKHVHRYQRVDISQTPHKKYLVMKCSLPDCTHYVSIPLAIGKSSICWRCGEEFVMTADLARLSKPHCKACTKVDESKKPDDNLLSKFLDGVI